MGRAKFGNKKVEFDGFKFDSKKERDRYIVLKTRQRAEVIEDLTLQPKFKFEIDGKPLKTMDKGARQVTYTADFQYIEDGKTIVEDVKSSFTAKDYTFKIKKALFETIFEKELKVVI